MTRLPRRILDIGIADIPLFRDLPIKDLGPARDFMDLERNNLLDPLQCLRESRCLYAPANRIEFRSESVQFLPFSAESSRPSSVPSAIILFEIRVASVAFGNHFDSPGHSIPNAGSFQRTSARRFRVIELRHLVEHFCLILERKETVGAAFRNIKRPMVLRANSAAIHLR